MSTRIGPSLFWLRSSKFRVRPFNFSIQTFSPFKLVLSTLPSQSFSFFDSDLPIFPGPSFPLFQVSPSHFFSQTVPVFWVSSSYFLSQTLPFFWVRPSHFSKSVLLTFFTVSFRILPIVCSDLITMCTVDKIKDVGVCRKRLHCYTNSLARETNQQNSNRQARKREK